MTGHKLYDPEETEGSDTLFGKCTGKFKIVFFLYRMTGTGLGLFFFPLTL